MAQGFRHGHRNGGDPLKTLTLFYCHFCGKNARFCLLQLPGGDASFNAVRPLLFDHHPDAQLAPRFFQVLRGHVGMGDPGRTGGNTDNGWCILRKRTRLRQRIRIQCRQKRLRGGRSLHARTQFIIRQPGGQRCQELHVRNACFRRRDCQQKNQFDRLRAIHTFPQKWLPQGCHRKGRFFHR